MSVRAPKEGWTPDYTLNTSVDLNEIGELVRDAFNYFHDEGRDTPYQDCLRDVLFDLHDKLYPGSSRIMGKDESLARTTEYEPDTIEGAQSQELLQVDNLLLKALANIHRRDVATKLLTDARESLGLFVAAYDLPHDGWEGMD